MIEKKNKERKKSIFQDASSHWMKFCAAVATPRIGKEPNTRNHVDLKVENIKLGDVHTSPLFFNNTIGIRAILYPS